MYAQIPNLEKENIASDLKLFTTPTIESPLSSKEIFINAIVQALHMVVLEDMKSEKPLLIKIKDGFIYSLARKIVENPSRSLILGVTGESASGKTTLVNNVMKAFLKENSRSLCTIIRCDDYFKDTSSEFEQAGSFEKLFEMGVNFDIPEAYELNKMKKHMLELFKGSSVTSPRYDFTTCISHEDGEEKFPSKIILSEGLFALDSSFKGTLDASIYIHTPADVIEQRWFDRAVTRGKTPDDAKVMFGIVKNEAKNHIIPRMKDADIVMNGLSSAQYIESFANRVFAAIDSALGQALS